MCSEKVRPQQWLGDFCHSESPLEMLFVELQWNCALPKGTDATTIGSSLLGSLIDGELVCPDGWYDADLCSRVD